MLKDCLEAENVTRLVLLDLLFTHLSDHLLRYKVFVFWWNLQIISECLHSIEYGLELAFEELNDEA